MTINPCCVPLKTGVRIVTHLSMALALATGWAGFKLISISSEVSSTVGVVQSVSPPLQPTNTNGGGESPSSNWYNNQHHQSQHIFQNHQVEQPGFRIPYEYLLYYNWHQQQWQRERDQQQHHGRIYEEDDDGQAEREYQRQLDDIIKSYQQHYRHHHRTSQPPPLPTVVTAVDKENTRRQRVQPPRLQSSQKEDDVGEVEDDEEEQSKIFREILRHRKNFKEPLLFRNSERKREGEAEDQVAARADQVQEDQIPTDLSPLFQQDSPRVGRNNGSSEEEESWMRMKMKADKENSQKDEEDEHDVPPAPGTMKMMMMINKSGSKGTRMGMRQLPDFKEQYTKVLLVCGLLAVSTVVFQFLTSFLLFCFVDKGSNAAAQIWTAVHCSVIFSLATCLVLFLCEGLSMPKYALDETLFVCLVSIDSLLSIYFLWVVMAFI